ncbi:hypothetical protein C8A03DRAFT_43357 [Achaetomium macrosporum]|uniref:LrgB-like protein n=1 Tax=Achaetomium macrosporum TaxID=79813 RepID=A0AAN7CBI0_9PEZI|nr:hypothetical protein C8A03DRAFT_43357 [Achaetomium macrosporum]
MAGVFILFWIAGCIIPGVEDFYRKRLKRATELLNRHMSIGFTVPVVMLCHGPLSDTRSIVMIIIGFVLTGLFNTVLAYFLAFPVQCLLVRCDKQFSFDRDTDIENGDARRTTKLSKRTSPWIYPRHWALRNPALLLCWLFTLILGVPLRYSAQSDVVLSTFLLFSVWLTTLSIQTSIKHNPHLASCLRTLLSGLFNAVLWTSLAMIAYVFTDSAISNRPLPAMLDTLQTHTSLSTLIVRAASAPPPPTPDTSASTDSNTPIPTVTMTLAAGDIAISILNSGLVAWGLKLYEYRLQLLSRGGLTVCTVSAVLALADTVCGPLFARHVLGVAPASRALAFAARSVTIALANPVMAMLGGDAGLNAAMVVGSGIVYQMGLGFGVGRWLEGKLGEGAAANDPRVVAAGVTVGINAAAMGTAYLYETQNEAAPHAALSMIALGTMTVVFSSITPLARWIMGSMST